MFETYNNLLCRLSSLQHLSVDSNQLTELPVELCALLRLEEFHAANNQLTNLPLEFGFLVNLERLHLQKNKIRELPEVKSARFYHYTYLIDLEVNFIPQWLSETWNKSSDCSFVRTLRMQELNSDQSVRPLVHLTVC